MVLLDREIDATREHISLQLGAIFVYIFSILFNINSFQNMLSLRPRYARAILIQYAHTM
jgi:hypothetical protein